MTRLILKSIGATTSQTSSATASMPLSLRMAVSKNSSRSLLSLFHFWKSAITAGWTIEFSCRSFKESRKTIFERAARSIFPPATTSGQMLRTSGSSLLRLNPSATGLCCHSHRPDIPLALVLWKRHSSHCRYHRLLLQFVPLPSHSRIYSTLSTANSIFCIFSTGLNLSGNLSLPLTISR